MTGPTLSAAQVARIDRALRRLHDLTPIIERCERCRIPMDEAKVLLEEQRVTLEALRENFGPGAEINAAIDQRGR